MARGKGDVTRAVERELEGLPDERLRTSGLAASALSLARDLDASSTPASSRAMCARELREHLDRLRQLAPPEEKRDRLDDLARRRAERVANRAAP